MASDNVELVKRSFQTLSEGGYEALLPLIHPEFEVTTPSEMASEPGTYRGPEGIRRYFESFYEAMEEISFEDNAYHELGDRVAVEFTLRARGRASGIEVEQKGVQVWELRDGKAIGLELYQTLEEALSAERDDAG